MMYGRPNHTLITTMERAEGADEGPERSQARTKQRKPSQKVILVYLQHEHLSTEVSRDKSRDMAGEVGRDPLLHRYILLSGDPETIPENSGILRFIWEHFQDVNHVVQHMKFCGKTFSAYKSF